MALVRLCSCVPLRTWVIMISTTCWPNWDMGWRRTRGPSPRRLSPISSPAGWKSFPSRRGDDKGAGGAVCPGWHRSVGEPARFRGARSAAGRRLRCAQVLWQARRRVPRDESEDVCGMTDALVEEYQRIKASHRMAIRLTLARADLGSSVMQSLPGRNRGHWYRRWWRSIPIASLTWRARRLTAPGSSKASMKWQVRLPRLTGNTLIFPGYKWGHATKVLCIHIPRFGGLQPLLHGCRGCPHQSLALLPN